MEEETQLLFFDTFANDGTEVRKNYILLLTLLIIMFFLVSGS